jgi:hypothetical protein
VSPTLISAVTDPVVDEVSKWQTRPNAIESLNSTLRKVVRVRGHFPNDEAAVKLLYLVIQNVEKKWTRQPQLLQPPVLLLELPEAPGLRELETAVLGLPETAFVPAGVSRTHPSAASIPTTGSSR